MNATEILALNSEEVRSRSIKVWKAIPTEKLNWKPDETALTCAEIIRHLLQGEFLFHQVMVGRSGKALANIVNPFEGKAFISVDDEIDFSMPYRKAFLEFIRLIPVNELNSIEIDLLDEGGYKKKLGEMLLRVSYHESVHTGQLLDYMRTMGIDRPKIWD
ncbi:MULTISPECIES: DinB family protein [unclassified Virgibacillus]|uniref:DinB family protein n=1 Tax=unclassified Virgibacillus TaxID=2620237 RepID=UPI0024DEF29B|nr:DinB family protein [Virgibacillus sp. LDC-1]